MVVWFVIVFMRQAELRRPSSQSELEKQRLRAGALFEEGLGPTEVAARLGVSVSSANRWKRRMRRSDMGLGFIQHAELLTKKKPHHLRKAHQ
ncbi:MAG: helix-turn-helix domain-containing protein [Armatimonadetes bacterium]|jgi:transposase|nr:helix-turn-helix domain-containing protein [Armatimonadota bacterium]